MRQKVVIITALVLCIVLAASAEVNLKSKKYSKYTVAVIPFLPYGSKTAQAVTRKFTAKLGKVTSFNIIDQKKMDALFASPKYKKISNKPFKERLKVMAKMVKADYFIQSMIRIRDAGKISADVRKREGLGNGPLVTYAIEMYMMAGKTAKDVGSAICESKKKYSKLKRRVVPKKDVVKYLEKEFPDLIRELISSTRGKI